MSILFLLLFTCSCGHNTSFLAKGKLLKAGPVLYVNGTTAFLEARENTEMKLNSEDEDAIGETDKKLPSKFNAEIRHGGQITGYLVDLSKECPDAAKEYTKNIK